MDDYDFHSFQNQAKELYESLSEDDKLKIFCHIIKSLYEAEIVNRTTFRGLLYDKFKFNLNSYTRAFDSGMLEIHNLLALSSNYQAKLKDLFDYLGIEMDNEEFHRVSHQFLYGFKEYSIKENTNN